LNIGGAFVLLASPPLSGGVSQKWFPFLRGFSLFNF